MSVIVDSCVAFSSFTEDTLSFYCGNSLIQRYIRTYHNMVTDTENVRKLAEDLEKQELDAPGGIPTSQVYAQLLAIYLYQNDLCNAKYLWKRIPQNVKNSHAELAFVWKVGQKMWQRDFPGVYAALNADWSENVGHIMQALLENVRKRAVYLVSHAYSSISVDDLAAYVGMPVEQAVLAATEQGWKMDVGSRMVKPCRPSSSPNQGASSEDQLYKLTEFVSFLEN